LPKPAPKSKLNAAIAEALRVIPHLDIPAKGRIVHHIRTGRIQRALALCAAGQLFIWKRIWTGAGASFLDQLNLLARLEELLRAETNQHRFALEI